MTWKGDLRKIIRSAERQGFRHERCGNNHHRFYPPDKSKSIVQCSSTTRDGGWMNKFLKELKDSGFIMEQNAKGATTSLGDALKDAMEERETEKKTEGVVVPMKARRGEVRSAILEVLQASPHHVFTIADVTGHLKARGFLNSSINSVGVTLSQMSQTGEVVRREKGCYQITFRENSGEDIKPTVAIGKSTIQSQPMVPSSVSDAALLEVSEDELELDEALAALGRIESVVRKYKEVIRRMRELKKLMERIP